MSVMRLHELVDSEVEFRASEDEINSFLDTPVSNIPVEYLKPMVVLLRRYTRATSKLIMQELQLRTLRTTPAKDLNIK